MKTVSREEVSKADESYAELLKKESHHDHEIIKDENGTFRWKENGDVNELLTRISLNDLCPLLCILGYNKNSEVYRQLYRDMGYSIFGYWEIFYWEVNNPEADDYVPNKDCIGKKEEGIKEVG